MASRRFPFPIPFGWFQVAFPSDLAPGEVTALEYWNRELVLWRDQAGAFHLQDAFCPHPDAHLPHAAPARRLARTWRRAARSAATRCSARSTAGATTARAYARTFRTASASTARRSCGRTR